MQTKRFILLTICLSLSFKICIAQEAGVKDVSFYLKQLRTTTHLPELVDAQTYMASTWDTTGGNDDGFCFKHVQGDTNVLLETNGPGYVSRIITGFSYGALSCGLAGTQIQVIIDGHILFDMPASDFLDNDLSPFPPPLLTNKSFIISFFPIPFAEGIKIQLINPVSDNWGCYWQIVYTTYNDEDTEVKSLSWPLNKEEQEELNKTLAYWKKRDYFDENQRLLKHDFEIESHQEQSLVRDGQAGGEGVIEKMYVSIEPNTPETWRNIRFRVKWDGSDQYSIDVPLGYFFGTADYGTRFPYSSILMGIDEKGAYCNIPMPYNQFWIEFVNQTDSSINISLMLDESLTPKHQGQGSRLHVHWDEMSTEFGIPDTAICWGKGHYPFLPVLMDSGRQGKYIGSLYHIAWNYTEWWGEGDWVAWTDDDTWPPKYHGTGSEEYFNSGWCYFDRKPVSGYIKMRPGNVNLYSFHLTDPIYYQEKIKMGVEIIYLDEFVPRKAIYGISSFYYAKGAGPAASRQKQIEYRLIDDGDDRTEENWPGKVFQKINTNFNTPLINTNQ